VRYRKGETSPLRLSRQEVEEAVIYWLKGIGRPEADRIKHVRFDVDWDPHDGGFEGAMVYLEDPKPVGS